MAEKILVVGGVALGPKAACRAKRLNPRAEVTIIDENRLVSYGGCGIPYYLSEEVQNLDDLRSTPYHTLRDPEFFRAMKGVELLTRTRATAIDRTRKTVSATNLESGAQLELPYDRLLLATGASPRRPGVPGSDLANIFCLTRLEAAEAVHRACQQGKVSEAVIVGAGFIGLEAAVALADVWGVQVSVVEMREQVLPGALPADLALMARHDLEAGGVRVFTSETVRELRGNGSVASVLTDKREIPAQLVIFAAGFLPNSELARAAGLSLADFGGILVDDSMRTSDPDIFAGGDCAAITNLITGKPGYMPLGSLANRQGRVIGTNLAGGSASFSGYVGSFMVKLFSMSFGGVGLTVEQAQKAGFDAVGVMAEQLDRAHFYPEKSMMCLELVADRQDRRVLGLQGACQDGIALKARVDAVAAALQLARPSVQDISNLEVAYSPPFASAMDIVNTVSNVTDNVLSGRMRPVSGADFMRLWEKRAENGVFFIDTRPAIAGRAIEAEHPDWHSIPLEEIRQRLDEIPRDRPIALICNTGLRSYDASLALAAAGLKDVVNSMGGMQAVGQMGLEP